jgi:hypothetical protein
MLLTEDITTPIIEVEVEAPPDMVNWFDRNARMVESGVASVGPAAAYALVWEWGNMRQAEKGPNTVLGTNPAGDKVWLSIQAPRGWIAINEPRMWRAIDEELDKLEFNGEDEFHISTQLEALSERVSIRLLDILKDTVPIDSGDLQSSLRVVEPGDALLVSVEDSFAEMKGNATDSGVLVIDRSFDTPLNG